jgi:hypothetical protein
LQIKTKIVSCHAADSKPVKLEVKGTVRLPTLVFPGPWDEGGDLPKLRCGVCGNVLQRNNFLNEIFDDGVEDGADCLAVDVRREDILPKSAEVVKLVENLADAFFRLCRQHLATRQLTEPFKDQRKTFCDNNIVSHSGNRKCQCLGCVEKENVGTLKAASFVTAMLCGSRS